MPFTKKLVQRVHCETLHEGVGLTMATVREQYWVPPLRALVKKVCLGCWGCKRFRAKAVTSPVPGLLLNDRTNLEAAFEVVGIDFAGPVRYRKSVKSEGKAYLAIFACSLSRAVDIHRVLEEIHCSLWANARDTHWQWWSVRQDQYMAKANTQGRACTRICRRERDHVEIQS